MYCRDALLALILNKHDFYIWFLVVFFSDEVELSCNVDVPDHDRTWMATNEQYEIESEGGWNSLQQQRKCGRHVRGVHHVCEPRTRTTRSHGQTGTGRFVVIRTLLKTKFVGRLTWFSDIIWKSNTDLPSNLHTRILREPETRLSFLSIITPRWPMSWARNGTCHRGVHGRPQPPIL